jgi:hypothetical protein
VSRPCIFILALILASLACGQYVTPTPTVSAPAPSTPTPAATAAALTATPSPTEAADSLQDVRQIKAVAVNVRAEPEGAVVGALQAGDRVTVNECSNNWCSISEPLEGWVWEGCLSGSEKGCEAR